MARIKAMRLTLGAGDLTRADAETASRRLLTALGESLRAAPPPPRRVRRLAVTVDDPNRDGTGDRWIDLAVSRVRDALARRGDDGGDA